MSLENAIMTAELKEISTLEELGRLRELADNLRPAYRPDIREDIVLPYKVSPHGNPADIVVVALGEADSNHPELLFDGHTLLGIYATSFKEHPKGERPLFPWRNHSKPAMHVYCDRIWVPPPFRKQGIAKQMLDYMQDVLRCHGYGNMEVKVEPDFLRSWIESQGFATDEHLDASRSHRYGKIL